MVDIIIVIVIIIIITAGFGIVVTVGFGIYNSGFNSFVVVAIVVTGFVLLHLTGARVQVVVDTEAFVPLGVKRFYLFVVVVVVVVVFAFWTAMIGKGTHVGHGGNIDHRAP